MNRRSEKTDLPPEEWPQYLLLELYCHYRETGNLCMPCGDLLTILGANFVRVAKGADGALQTPVVARHGPKEHGQAITLMEQRGWVRVHQPGAMQDPVCLTADGLRQAQRLKRPWYIKMWDFMKGDVRTIIVGGISGVVAAVLTIMILRVLGLG